MFYKFYGIILIFSITADISFYVFYVFSATTIKWNPLKLHQDHHQRKDQMPVNNNLIWRLEYLFMYYMINI